MVGGAARGLDSNPTRSEITEFLVEIEHNLVTGLYQYLCLVLRRDNSREEIIPGLMRPQLKEASYHQSVSVRPGLVVTL